MEDWRKIIRDNEEQERQRFTVYSSSNLSAREEEQRKRQEMYDYDRRLIAELAQVAGARDMLEYVQRDVWKKGRVVEGFESVYLPHRTEPASKPPDGDRLSFVLRVPYISKVKEFKHGGFEPYGNTVNLGDMDPPVREILVPTGRMVDREMIAEMSISFTAWYRLEYPTAPIVDVEFHSNAGAWSGANVSLQERKGYSPSTMTREDYFSGAESLMSGLKLAVARDCKSRTEKGLLPL